MLYMSLKAKSISWDSPIKHLSVSRFIFTGRKITRSSCGSRTIRTLWRTTNGWRRIHPQTPGNLSIRTSCVQRLLRAKSRAWICEPFKEPKNRFQPGRPVRKPYLKYRPARLHRLAEPIPGLLNRFQIHAQGKAPSKYFLLRKCLGLLVCFVVLWEWPWPWYWLT